MAKIYGIICCLLLCGQLKAQVAKVYDEPVTISFRRDSLKSVLIDLQNKTRTELAFDPVSIPRDKFITQNFVATPFSQVLTKVLEGTGLTYALLGNAYIISRKKPVYYTINGRLRDHESGEDLIGASISIPALKAGAITNEYGFYSLTLPEGDYQLTISSLGYAPFSTNVELDHNQELNKDLTIMASKLDEVIVDAETTGQASQRTGALDMPIEAIKRLPYYAGVVDLIKALQMQNGIKAMTEGSSGLFIRGGNSDQNLIMLDEAMVYNPSHLFGLVSVFNPDAIKNVQVYKDYIPANYGGRLSSVIDTRMADGNNKEFHLQGGVNFMSARIAAEGPIQKNKGSYMVTFRRSLIDLLNQNFKLVNPNSTFYDVNLKSNFQISKNNRVFYSFYFGDDQLFSKNSYGNNWGNITSTFRWNHIFSSRLFFNMSAIYSDYKNVLDVNADTISEKYQWQTGIRDVSLKGDFAFYKSPENEIKFGIIGTIHNFTPGRALTAFPDIFNIPRNVAGEYAAYISHQVSPVKNLLLNYGIRAGLFRNGEDRPGVFDANGNPLKVKRYSTYRGLEPRAYIAYQLPANQTIHAAYNHTNQYLQLVQNNELAFSSLETWMPAAADTRPQRSDYGSLGYDYVPKGYKFLAAVYYKSLKNQPELKDHAPVIQNPLVREQLLIGKSKAYGAELIVAKTAGAFTADLAYCWSRVFRRMNGVNGGRAFPANYDIPHDLKLSASYAISEQLSVSTFFNYSTGKSVTLPVGFYMHDGIRIPIFEERNTSRFPPFHRMDFSARYRMKPLNILSHPFSGTFSCGIYNLYNRKNPLFYRIKQEAFTDSPTLVESSNGIMPYIAYNFRF